MGADSKIEWCHHTFNPWVGCTKVSPGCDNCYAEAMMDKRLGALLRHAADQLASHARTIEALKEALTNAVGALAYCERDVLSPNDVMRPKVEATLASARRTLKERPNGCND